MLIGNENANDKLDCTWNKMKTRWTTLRLCELTEQVQWEYIFSSDGSKTKMRCQNWRISTEGPEDEA